MSARAVLNAALAAGFRLESKGAKLHVEPTPPSDLLDQLREHKPAILELLANGPMARETLKPRPASTVTYSPERRIFKLRKANFPSSPDWEGCHRHRAAGRSGHDPQHAAAPGLPGRRVHAPPSRPALTGAKSWRPKLLWRLPAAVLE